MQIAFYAPLKPPDHPAPSGDRTLSRLLLTALRRAGYQPEVASRLRARLALPTVDQQHRLAMEGAAKADALLAHYRNLRPEQRPRIWFTYHLYYKAVDWIGPKVAAALGIPYVVAEASYAPKRANGPWALSHAAVEAALGQAAAVFCLNPADRPCLAGIVAEKKLIDLPPFLDLAHFRPQTPDPVRAHAMARLKLAAHYSLDPRLPWLLAVAMMRPGDKLSSYLLLARALADYPQPFQLLLAGDGEARAAIETAFHPLKARTLFLGMVPTHDLPMLYEAADLFVWPAINEAFGMALLEAQACGCPVLAGRSGGVGAIVADGQDGWLVPPGDAAAFRAQLSRALAADCAHMGSRARERVLARHDIAAAAQTLKTALTPLVRGRAASSRAGHRA